MVHESISYGIAWVLNGRAHQAPREARTGASGNDVYDGVGNAIQLKPNDDDDDDVVASARERKVYFFTYSVIIISCGLWNWSG